MLAEAELVLFGIEAALRINAQFRHSFADSTRSRALTLPLPDFPSERNRVTIENWYRNGLGQSFVVTNLRVKEILNKLMDTGDLPPDWDEDLFRLYNEHFALLNATEQGLVGVGESPAGLANDDVVQLLTICHWQEGQDPNPTMLRRMAGTLINIAVYGYFQPVVLEVVERYLDCVNPRSGFARIRCPDCHGEHLLTFSCKTRGFRSSCHAKRLEEWGEWVWETLLLDVPHRQIVLTIPKRLRIFFKFRRRLLGEFCRAAVRTLMVYFEALAGEVLVPGIIVSVQTFGGRINFHPHLHLLVTEGEADRAGLFRRLLRLDDVRLADLFGREALRLLVAGGLLSPEWAERILS